MAVLAAGQIVAMAPSMKYMSSHTAVRALMNDAQLSRSVTSNERSDLDANGCSTEQVIEVENLHKYFGTHHVLKGISCGIGEGKITVVIGGSGSGKSVMIKHMIGLMSPTEGSVRVFGDDLASMAGKERQKLQQRIGMLFQSAALFDSMTT